MVPKIWNIVQEKYEIGCRKGMKYGAKIYETLAGKILNVVKKNIKKKCKKKLNMMQKNMKYDAEKVWNIVQEKVKYGAEKYEI